MKFTSTTAPTLSGSNTARTVTLTGSNTDANTLAAPVGDNGTGATSVNKTGSGTWLLTGANTYTGATNVSQGTLQVGASGTGSTASGSGITVTGTSFTTTGTGGPNDPVLLGGSVAALAGSGTVGGNTVVGSNTVGSVGVIRPGDSAGASNGALNFLGDLTVKDGSQIQMGVTTTSKNDAGFDWTAGNALSYVTTHYNAGSPDATYTNYWQTASGNYDTLKITGNTVLGTGGLAYGTISVSSLGGSFSAGDVFKLIDWAGVGTLHSLAGGGSFNIATDLVLPDISGSSLGWDTSAFDTFGVLVVVPEPGRFMFLLLGLGALIMRRRRRTIQD